MPRKTALALGYKIVGTRWLDINKGDDDKPDYRSRLVGKEYNDGFEEGLFASTPPLEALRWLLSEQPPQRMRIPPTPGLLVPKGPVAPGGLARKRQELMISPTPGLLVPRGPVALGGLAREKAKMKR